MNSLMTSLDQNEVLREENRRIPKHLRHYRKISQAPSEMDYEFGKRLKEWAKGNSRFGNGGVQESRNAPPPRNPLIDER